MPPVQGGSSLTQNRIVMIFLVLLFMFFLGIVQVVWALIHGFTAKDRGVRRHFGFYGIGVLLYFLLLWVNYHLTGEEWENPAFGLHFFAGAFALATYHVWIVVRAIRLREVEPAMEQWV